MLWREVRPKPLAPPADWIEPYDPDHAKLRAFLAEAALGLAAPEPRLDIDGVPLETGPGSPLGAMRRAMASWSFQWEGDEVIVDEAATFSREDVSVSVDRDRLMLEIGPGSMIGAWFRTMLRLRSR